MTTAAQPFGVAFPPPGWGAGRCRVMSRVAWTVAAAVPILIIGDVVLHLHTGSTDLTSWWLGDVALAAVLAVPGLLVALKRPDNAIGWLLCAASFTTALAGAGREYLAFGFLGGTAPGYLWIGWFTDSIYMISMAALPLILMLFPDGHAMSRRARLLLLMPIASMALGVFGSLFYKGGDVHIRGRLLRNPAGGVLPRWLSEQATSLSMMLFFASVVVAIAVLVVRYRRSGGEARLQMKWVVWAGGIGVLELASETLPNNTIATVTGPVASGLLTVSVCIAILRHRMFDIDLVINRTLVFAALTAAVVGSYVAVVAVLSAALGQPVRLGIGLLATALVAIAFAPARQHLQRAVDRLVYGERNNPYGVMTQLGRRLESSGEHGELAVVVDTVTQALKLPYAAIVATDGVRLAECGRPRRAPHREPLIYQGSCIGELVVEPRGARADFNRRERQLLADLARQVAAAVHAVRLSADLQASRRRLVNAKEEERRRLRRDLHDGLGPKLAAIALKLDAARTVVDSRPDTTKAVLRGVKLDIRATIEDIRHLVYGLRPPALDELGLVAALRESARRFDPGGGGIAISVEAPDDLPQLPAAVEVAVYWIVNEAVTNVVRHASARHCRIRLRLVADAVVLAVCDDGAGLPELWRPGVGTASMFERAAELGGTLSLRAPEGQPGTEVHVSIPLAPAAGDRS